MYGLVVVSEKYGTSSMELFDDIRTAIGSAHTDIYYYGESTLKIEQLQETDDNGDNYYFRVYTASGKLLRTYYILKVDESEKEDDVMWGVFIIPEKDGPGNTKLNIKLFDDMRTAIGAAHMDIYYDENSTLRVEQLQKADDDDCYYFKVYDTSGGLFRTYYILNILK